MVESEKSSDNCNTLKISIETIIKNQAILQFVLYHVKTKTMCKNADKKFLLVITYIPD